MAAPSPGTVRFKEVSATPSVPPSGYCSIYAKTDNVLYLLDSSGVEVALGSASSITQLIGDVLASGPGIATATVSFVGGKSSAAIATSVNDTLAATSANTFSTIVKRDSSGDISVTHVNGVVVETHASRHLPSGSDPITTAAPLANLSATTTNSTGTANSLSRSDHSHGINTGVPVSTGDANATGSSANLARADHVHNVLAGSGLQNVSGTLSPVYGSTSNTVTQGNDSRLSTANEVRVKQNPGAGEFSSVAAAISSITTASAFNPYVITIGPGIYVEPQLVMKEHVDITGSSASSTILVSAVANQTFVISSDACNITGVTISGASGINGIGIYQEGTTGLGVLVKDCVIADCRTLVSIYGATPAPTSFQLQGIYGVAPFTTGVLITNTGGNYTSGLLDNVFFVTQGTGTPATDCLIAHGPGVVLTVKSTYFLQDSGTGTAINMYDGASLSSVGCLAQGFNRGLWVQNTGAAPALNITSLYLASNVSDIDVEHMGTTGSLQGNFQASLATINANSLDLFFTDPTDGITFTGDLSFGPNFNNKENVTDLIIKGPTMGLYDGGEPTDGGGFDVDITAGNGYLYNGTSVKRYTWANTSITLLPDTTNYIYFNTSGILSAASIQPSTAANILICRVITNSTGIEFIDDSPVDAVNYGNSNDDFVRSALGSIFETGCIVTENATPFHLNVTQGVYFFGNNRFAPTAGTNINFDTFYSDGGSGHIIGTTNVVDNSFYDDGSGTLAPITAGYFVRHALYLLGDGVHQKYLFVYSQSEYATLVQAENGSLPLPPSYFDDGVVLIASLIVQEGASPISEIRDERPVIGFKASGTNSAIIHGNLLGLTADDHQQYLLVDGSRAMSADLDMGVNSITNVNLVDGVDVSSHESRHLPNGSDPLTTAAPTTNLDSTTTNDVGIQNSLARSDHSHAISTGNVSTQIPDQSNSAGSSANLAKADHIHNIPAATPVQIGTTNFKGAAATFALSDHVHDHGAQTSGTLHAAATTSVNGFMSAADKLKLDTNVPTTLGTSNQVLGVNNAGTAAEYKSLTGTANQIVITNGVGSKTFSTPQDIATSSVPTFAGENLTGRLELTEQVAPSTPASTKIDVFAEASNGFTRLRVLDSTGIKNTLLRDSILLVKNSTGSTIAAGKGVYYTGADATTNLPTVALAKADASTTVPCIGVTIESIANGSVGRVIAMGIVTNVDTSAFAQGDKLYLSATTAGNFTATKPISPNIWQRIGIVLISNASTGAIEVRPFATHGEESGTNTAFTLNVTALTDAANIATNAALGNTFTVTLGGNRNLSAPTNPVNGQKITYRITQDGTGNRGLTFDAVFNFGLDIISFVPSTGANKTDYIGCIYNGSTSKWDVIAVSKGFS